MIRRRRDPGRHAQNVAFVVLAALSSTLRDECSIGGSSVDADLVRFGVSAPSDRGEGVQNEEIVIIPQVERSGQAHVGEVEAR